MSVQPGRYRHLLLTYLKPQRGQVAWLTMLLFASIGLQLANPQVIGAFIDATQSRSPLQTLLLAALLFITLSILQRVVAFFATYVATNVGWSATNALRENLTRHCLQLDMSFYKTHTPGELIERLDDDITALANFFSQFIVNIAGNGLLILGILLLLFRENWRIGVGFTLYGVLAFFALRAVQGVAVKRWTTQRQATADFYGFLEEHISGTEDIRASGAEQYVTHRLFSLMRRLLENTRLANLVSNITLFSTNFLYALGYTIGLALGAYLYNQKQITIGGAYLLVFYIGMFSKPLESIREQVQDLQKASASIERVEELSRLQPEAQGDGKRLPAGSLALEFSQVSFSYEPVSLHSNEHLHSERLSEASRKSGVGARNTEFRSASPDRDIFERIWVPQEPSLHDISFRVQPGKILGLLGRTGSGKTTLARLLFRLYDPLTGTIRLHDVDIREVALDDLRSHVGMVTQDVQLFHASVRDNLTFFNRRISDAQIEQALKELHLWQWARSLPEGLDTRLAPGGQSLSAGEAQLLAFARVFLKNPGLLILDEASSRLDPATEHLLEQAIDRLLQDRTGIVIAHRLPTVQRADEIMILEDGRIVEYGPRAALAADPTSRFSHLLQTGLEKELA